MDSLEILKASVPFATIAGVIVGALLNSRLGRKDKIRDHLFSYKVKSYTILAECTSSIKRDISNYRTNLRVNKSNEAKTINDIWEELVQVSNQQSLFLSKQTKHDLFELDTFIYNAFNKEMDSILDPTKYSTEDMIKECNKLLIECDKFIERVQIELGIDKLNSK